MRLKQKLIAIEPKTHARILKIAKARNRTVKSTASVILDAYYLDWYNRRELRKWSNQVSNSDTP